MHRPPTAGVARPVFAPLGRAVDAYRATGAELPVGVIGRDHGSPMEGYLWRIVHEPSRTVVVGLCAACRAGSTRWGLVALACEPQGSLRHLIADAAVPDRHRFGVVAPGVLDGGLEHLDVRIGEADWLDVTFADPVGWPRRRLGAVGAGSLVPGLGQYWQPVLLDAVVHGEACIGGKRLRLDRARAYAEKNWGPGFPGRWWWGQAGAFAGGEVGVAFAGGHVSVLGTAVAPTAVVLRLGRRIVSFAPPTSRAVVSVGDGRWRLKLRSPGHRLTLEAESGPGEQRRLPVPVLDPPGIDMSAHHTFAGRLRLHLSRRGRTVIEAECDLAGLEEGQRLQPAPSHASVPQPDPPRR